MFKENLMTIKKYLFSGFIKRDLSILLLLTIVIAFASPVSATGYITGIVKYENATGASGVKVIATNDATGATFETYSISDSSYVISVPSSDLPGYYTVTGELTGYVGTTVSGIYVSDGNTSIAQDVILTVSTGIYGHAAGTVKSSENILLSNATVKVYRLNMSSAEYEPIIVNGVEKETITDENGEYTLSFIPIWIDLVTQFNYIIPDYWTGELGNQIKIEANKDGYNNGYAITWIGVDKTATADIVLTTKQPDEIYVSVDNSEHQKRDTPLKEANGISTWTVTAQLKIDSADAPIEGQEIKFTIDDPSIATFSGASSTTAVTDSTGKATVIMTSTLNGGEVKVRGTYLTRDNVLLSDYDYAKSVALGQISGDITNENQEPLPGAVVSLELWNGTGFEQAKDINGNPIPSQITPESGHYSFTDVPSGTYKITASYGELSGFAYPVYVTSGTVTADVVIVGAKVRPIISISPDKRNYTTGDEMHTNLEIINNGDTGVFDVLVWLELPNGNKYWVMQKYSITLPSGLDWKKDIIITLPNIASGDYIWHAEIKQNGQTISESTATWTFIGVAASENEISITTNIEYNFN